MDGQTTDRQDGSQLNLQMKRHFLSVDYTRNLLHLLVDGMQSNFEYPG